MFEQKILQVIQAVTKVYSQTLGWSLNQPLISGQENSPTHQQTCRVVKTEVFFRICFLSKKNHFVGTRPNYSIQLSFIIQTFLGRGCLIDHKWDVYLGLPPFVPTMLARHHQDHYNSWNRESQPKPSFTTLAAGRSKVYIFPIH